MWSTMCTHMFDKKAFVSSELMLIQRVKMFAFYVRQKALKSGRKTIFYEPDHVG